MGSYPAAAGHRFKSGPRYKKRRVDFSALLLYFYTMNYFVYVLYSDQYKKVYIGITGDLEKRLFAHNNLPKGWTKNFRPWVLAFYEEYSTKYEALKREKSLKSHQGREFIRMEIIPKII